MKIRYYHVDAFTGNAFGGNPAGVIPLMEWLEDDLLQKIAAENNLSETAFFVPRSGHYELRWFTPAMEVDLCGHATLASAFVLFSAMGVEDQTVLFHSQSGPLIVERSKDLLILDFPALPAEKCNPPDALLKGLGKEPIEAGKARDYLAIFETQAEILALQPDFSWLEKLDCLGIIVTAPGDGVDFVSRFFAPRAGIPEDPVTGSAHCTLVPYWAKRLQKQTLTAMQLSKRRGGLICEDRGERVKIGGKAVLYMSGEIEI